MHIYRWDLDKTYLDTDLDSVRSLIRQALEPARRKRNIPGSAALVRSLVAHDPDCRVAILSGSPTQMRKVLQEKLALDGVRVDELTLKDNLGNLRRGRLRAVTGQVGYKLPTLLRQRVGLGPAVEETLFGDDAEVDALVYSLYADLVAGRAGENELTRVMDAGGAYADSIHAARSAWQKIGPADAVKDIFIHLDRGTPPDRFHLLGPRVIPVFSWLQAAIVLWDRGRLSAEGVAAVSTACQGIDGGTAQAPDGVGTDLEMSTRLSGNTRQTGEELARPRRSRKDRPAAPGLELSSVAALFQDLVRRQILPGERIAELLAHDELQAVRPRVGQALRWLGSIPAPPPLVGRPDYLAFLRVMRED